MNEDIGNTQERPAVKARRVNTQRRETRASSDGDRRTTNARRQSAAQGRRQARDTRSTRRADADERRQSTRQPRQQVRREGQRRQAQRNTPQRNGVPAAAVFLLSLVLIAATAGITYMVTRRVMQPQIEEAQRETSQAKSQITTLTNELQKKVEEIDELQEKNGSSSKDTSTQDTSKDDATEGVDSPWTASGKFSSGDTMLDTEVKAFCDARADTSLGKDSAALEVYKGVAWSEYVERDAAQHPSGKDWRTQFARMYYENDCSGNCYEFAAFLSYCLQYLGYSDATAQGVLIELQGGGWGDHGIVYVTNTDGSACLCDTSRGTDGWMLPEGSYNVQIQDFESA